MSEKNETDLNNAQNSQEKVGDILRKERITRRITVETIAKDLKLNVKYIKALETSDYDSLPADPYVRVYLKSLAKYLSLNPDEILTNFYKERGLNLEKKDTSSKIEISMQKKDDTGNPMPIVAIVLILFLAVFSFLANRNGWISNNSQQSADSVNETTGIESDTILEPFIEDTLIPSALQQPDTFDISNSDDTTVADTQSPMQLKVMTTSDSVWIQVFSDGESWKNLIHKNQAKEFSASDSFNIHVGNNSIVTYTLNNKPVKVKGKGIMTFKLDRDGKTEIWPLSKWNRIFKDRL